MKTDWKKTRRKTEEITDRQGKERFGNTEYDELRKLENSNDGGQNS